MEAMKQTYFRRPAYESFDKKFSKRYSSTLIIIKAFFIALCLSAFIYLDYFSLHVKLLDSVLAIVGFYFLMQATKKEMFFVGFFIGLLWFYWISFSFVYYELPYLIPLVIFGVGVIYGTIFYILGLLTPNTFLRVFGILGLSFVEPFGFNWLKLELSLINSYFSTDFFLFAAFIFLVYLLVILQKAYKFIALACLLALPLYPLHVKQNLAPLSIKVSHIFLDQAKKWDKRFKNEITDYNLQLIKDAIKEQREVIILPESAFPTYLNLEKELLNELKNLSNDIVILTGGLSVQENRVLNSTYLFQDGDVAIAHKYILVPFGESIPLPKFAKDFINEIFFNGAEDYESSKAPHDFTIKGIKFRNAICFEATKDELFIDNPKYMVAISNNAWFTPSIEPTLQNLLLKYHARKHNTTIYHSANAGLSAIIR
jgi:apolipoprotein N-acyltransferase